MRRDVMLYASEREPRDFGRMRERAVRRSVLARCWQGANAITNRTACNRNRNSFKHLCAQVGKLALANAGMNARRHRTAQAGSTARLARLAQTTGGQNWAESLISTLMPASSQLNFSSGLEIFPALGDFR